MTPVPRGSGCTRTGGSRGSSSRSAAGSSTSSRSTRPPTTSSSSSRSREATTVSSGSSSGDRAAPCRGRGARPRHHRGPGDIGRPRARVLPRERCRVVRVRALSLRQESRRQVMPGQPRGQAPGRRGWSGSPGRAQRAGGFSNSRTRLPRWPRDRVHVPLFVRCHELRCVRRAAITGLLVGPEATGRRRSDHTASRCDEQREVRGDRRHELAARPSGRDSGSHPN